MTAASIELDLDGPAAPPRSNGELVFAEPWESRTFGMAMAMSAGGVFGWDEFREALISRIKLWESAPPEGECWSYYRCWQQALEDIVAGRNLVPRDGVAERGRNLADRPAGYDHDHDHGEDEGHDHEH